MLIVLPSGWETRLCSVTVSPFDGAISSVSHISPKAEKASRWAIASSLLASLSICSRLPASPTPNAISAAPNMALIRGSILVSSAILLLAMLTLDLTLGNLAALRHIVA